MRTSIAPTYDSRETGERYDVEYRLNDRRVHMVKLSDPFVNATLYVGWKDLLRGVLRRRLKVTVIVGGDCEIVEDVSELDGNYLGRYDSTRRAEWDSSVECALRDLAARESEHDV